MRVGATRSHYIKKVLCVLTLGIGLSGCVTENRLIKADKSVVLAEVNQQEVAKTRISLGIQYLAAGETTQAKFNFDRALKLAPDLPEAHYSLAYYYEQVGERQLADKAYQSALKVGPNNPDTLHNYGTFLCRIGRFDDATEKLKRAISIPSYLRVSQSYENLALCAIRQDDFSLAEEYLQSAINHNSNRSTTQVALASLYYAKSQLHRAQDIIETLTERGNMSSRTLLLEHLLHLQMGHLQQAETIATTLIRTYPSSIETRQVINGNLQDTEFERLRKQYQDAQLQALTENSGQVVAHRPRIKIKRKKVTEPLSSQTSGAKISKAQTRLTADSLNQIDNSSGLNKKPDIQINESQNVSTPPKSTQLEVAPAKALGQVEFYEVERDKTLFNQDVTSANEPRLNRAAEVSTFESSNSASKPLLNRQLVAPEVPVHVAMAGENLFSISVKYEIKLRMLLLYNQLSESDRLIPGQKVYLKDPNILHLIQPGDTLLNIAEKHGVLIDELMRWNKLTPDIALKAGHNLLIVDPNNYIL